MSRHFFTFLGTFVLGALIALAARAAWFNPNADHAGHAAGGEAYPPMVANTHPSPARDSQHASSGARPAASGHDHAQPVADAHASHQNAAAPKNEPSPASSPATAPKTVNSICAICGMEVDPDLPTAEYQGKTIGFGCRACPPKFKANPDKYGPAYLRNEVVKG
jgi:YHS domain-containing protein